MGCVDACMCGCLHEKDRTKQKTFLLFFFVLFLFVRAGNTTRIRDERYRCTSICYYITTSSVLCVLVRPIEWQNLMSFVAPFFRLGKYDTTHINMTDGND